MSSSLRVDWCDHKAAKFAVENFHYTKAMPASKRVSLGVWEQDKFIGAVIFSRGANNNIGKPFGLDQTSIVELTRVALTKHETPVSQIVSIAIKLLKKQSPGLKLIVSYADPARGHVGSIYQAMNWVYVGEVICTPKYLLNGRWVHARQANSIRGTVKGLKHKEVPDKHKYLYLLDTKDKSLVSLIEAMRKPYPKLMRVADSSEA